MIRLGKLINLGKVGLVLLVFAFAWLILFTPTTYSPLAETCLDCQESSMKDIDSPSFVSPPLPGVGEGFENRTYGTTDIEFGNKMINCSDGGYIIVGYTNHSGAGGNDVFVLRMDQYGNHLWNRTYGGAFDDIGEGITEVSGGGYIITGETFSFGAGDWDMWVLRIDATGNLVWNRTFGYANNDCGRSVIEVSSGGFAIVGHFYFIGSPGFQGCLVRIDNNGNHLWNQTYGSGFDEKLYGVVECASGGFALSGWSKMTNGAPSFWLVRTDQDGNQLWNQVYGGYPSHDYGYYLLEVSGSGFILCGQTKPSYVGSNWDLWVVRTDQDGNHVWNFTLGGPNPDVALGVLDMGAEGFAVVGYTDSFGTGTRDGWLVGIDTTGNQLWNITFGGVNSESFGAILKDPDNGFLLGGSTMSYGAGNWDIWLLWAKLHWKDEPTNQTVEFGAGFHYDLDAISYVIIDEWWLNDTTHFTIDEDGIITSTTSLGPHGTAYGLQVWVNDSQTNLISANFTVTIQDTIAPSWVTPPVDQFLGPGETLHYDLDATDLSGLDSWWLNDTTHFAIDINGIITNTTGLTTGKMGLQVWVNDTSGNSLTSSFTITVDITPPVWDQVPTDQYVEFGSIFTYGISASDWSGIDHYWINDTIRFSIDGNGLISNLTMLAIGAYGLEVRVYDPYANYGTAEFTVTIQDSTSPTWDEAPSDQILEFGDSFQYNLNASDLSGIDHWWISNTTHFTVYSNGLITSAILLPVGDHWVEVHAYDPYNNYCSAVIHIRVQDTGSPLWVVPPTDQIMQPGDSLSYQLQATDLSGIAYWSVNDTVHFNIDSEGLLTNQEVLNPGIYGLTVTATDPYGNSLSATFSITVESVTTPPPPIPGFPLESIVVALLGALGLGVLIRCRRRK